MAAGAGVTELPPIGPILAGGWRGKPRHDLRSSGFVAHSLEAALWRVAETDDFRAAVLLAANLGDDADTTAAIAGQVAGALYGASGISSNGARASPGVSGSSEWRTICCNSRAALIGGRAPRNRMPCR